LRTGRRERDKCIESVYVSRREEPETLKEHKADRERKVAEGGRERGC
jgi:hypothetical protein